MASFSSPSPRLSSGVVAAVAACLIAAFVVPNLAFAQTPTFNTLISTGANVGSGFPETAAVGDINGDGKLDAMIAGFGGVRVMVGNGNGTFSDRGLSLPSVDAGNVVNLPTSLAPYLPRPVSSVGEMQVVDVNHDGKLDLATVESVNINGTNYNFIGVWLNTGNDGTGLPQFTATHHYSPFLGVRPVTVGDLNGDGWADFILGTCCNGIQAWTSNGGNGTFTPVQAMSLTPGAGGPSVGQGVITDLDGDGKADYVVSSNQNGGANVFFGNGNGTFVTPALFLPNGAVSVAVTDVNGDGRPDLLMGNLTGGSEGLLVYVNNGGRAFSAPALYPVAPMTGGYNGNTSLALGDVNGDGKLDAVLSDFDSYDSSHNVAVLLADSSGGFGDAFKFSTGSGSAPTHVFVGNFAGDDSRADIGVVLRNARAFGVFTNTTPAALPTQTLTILGGLGNVGDFATNVEYFNPATGNWQPAYLASYLPDHPVTHPWGNITGTNHWINYRTNGISDPDAGPTTNQTKWYLYRVRFTVPADAINPKMTFSVKADNFIQVGINGVTTGGSTQFINNANVPNVIVGTTDQFNADAVFSQAVHTGENTITLNVGDWGGLNGFNFRIDLSMQSSQPIDVVPVQPDTVAPVITAPADITKEATSAAGAVATFTATATDDKDGSVPVTASPASGSTFAIGTTAVNLSASDAAGNTATASFTVTVQDTIAPVVSVPANITAEATSALGAAVTYAAPTATDAVGVASLVSNPPSGSTFPLGTTTVTATAKDAAGNTGSGSFTVAVQDTTAPVVGSVTPSTGLLWPPNHRMVAIALNIAASDAVGVTGYKVTVTSSEPDNGLGDGDTANDIQISGNGSLTPAVSVRAERAGNGNGRTYTISVVAVDAVGNASAAKTTTVFVPKSMAKK